MQNKIFLNFKDSLILFKLGLNIITTFYYGRKDKQIYNVKDIFTGVTDFERIYVPAYTDSDLNSILPGKITFKNKTNVKDSYDLIIYKSAQVNDKYFVEYKNNSGGASLVQQWASTEVEAKSEMIIFLYKKGLLK